MTHDVPALLYGRNGLGDAIYVRAVARMVSRTQETYVATAWPELFQDLPVRLLRPTSALYGPNANVARWPTTTWSPVPAQADMRDIRYEWRMLRSRSILAQMEQKARTTLHPFIFDLPPFGLCVDIARAPASDRRIAVVRPVTLRTDWPNAARNPDPAYVARAAALLMDAGFHVISIADLVPGIEEPLGVLPPAHTRYDHGELGVEGILSLIRDADLVVGGPGWIVPACVAAGTPLLVIGGGQAGCNGAQALLDPRMQTSRIRWIVPDHYCRCVSKRHTCPKHIGDFDRRFQGLLGTLAMERVA